MEYSEVMHTLRAERQKCLDRAEKRYSLGNKLDEEAWLNNAHGIMRAMVAMKKLAGYKS